LYNQTHRTESILEAAATPAQLVTVPCPEEDECSPPPHYVFQIQFLEKLLVVQLFNNFPAFYGTPRFITVFTRALH
jgi:hypothetical protein